MPITTDSPHADDLNDFAAECDEHLSSARQVLLDLEATPDAAYTTGDRLDALFRHFHTVKGLSGMVGARAAEDFAHHLETYLGAVRKGRLMFTDLGVDILLQGVGAIECAIAAFRDGRPPPDTAALSASIAALLPSPPSDSNATPPVDVTATATTGNNRAKLEAALRQGWLAWQVTFTPSSDLAARGVNVNAVRARLQAAGEIIHAEPSPVPGGGVRFTFLLAAPTNTDFVGWAADGLTVESYRPLPESASSPIPAPVNVTVAPANLVRVDLGRLDDLLRVVGELVLSRARLDNGLIQAAGHLPARERRELEETALAIERQLRELREGVMRVRLVPVRTLFARMRLVVRDLVRETGKEVELVVAGEETEIDKFVAERMTDPLLHLVRNAVSHGIEPAAERAAVGKPSPGRVSLRAAAAGGMIVLEVEDDGRGVDTDAVFSRGRTAGLISTDAPADPASVLDLLCTPGFSTREAADRASGRGVGMDVVRRAVEELGGTLALDSRSGTGTRFVARLPLTLVVADVLTVVVGGRLYAVPQSAVREVVPIESGETTLLENNELVRYHEAVLPLLRLGDLFGSPRPAGAFVALVVGEGTAAVALAADRAIGLREVVVRPLADPLVQAPGFGGATELGDGLPVLILDPAGLARFARRLTRTAPIGG